MSDASVKSVLLPCPFCGATGRCGPDGAYYFQHKLNCWIYIQNVFLMSCVSHAEIEQWNCRSTELEELK